MRAILIAYLAFNGYTVTLEKSFADRAACVAEIDTMRAVVDKSGLNAKVLTAKCERSKFKRKRR